MTNMQLYVLDIIINLYIKRVILNQNTFGFLKTVKKKKSLFLIKLFLALQIL